MSAWNASELGRLVHRYGGEPVGSFHQDSYRPLTDSVAHAIFYDLTHDNESLIKSHCVYDALASSSLVAMSSCAIASTRGFDELVPHHINVVTETRAYAKWPHVNLTHGIIKAKSILNKLHFELGEQNFSQIYVDQFDADTVVITRHNPKTHQSFILIARTAFSRPNEWTSQNVHKPLTIPSRVASVLMEANLEQQQQQQQKQQHSANSQAEFQQSQEYINGLTDYELVLNENVSLEQSRFIDRIDYNGSESQVHFKYFPPGAVCLFRVELNESSLQVLPFVQEACLEGDAELEAIVGRLSYDELNILLFRCSQEETNEGISSDVYVIPGHGALVYCGLRGFMNVLDGERLANNLGHAMFENLRQGSWMMTYTVERLRKYGELKPVHRANLLALSQRLGQVFDALDKMPRYLIPAYFDSILSSLYSKSLERCVSLMSSAENNKFEIVNGSSFLKSLALTGFVLNGNLRSAQLPNTIVDRDQTRLMLSLSAGLPFFSVSYMRSWGRDTFISLRGALLLVNRFDDAKDLILAYGSCLRHGLIPNLLCEGRSARYNCRDAVWWWLKAIKDFTELAPNGMNILNSELYRLYPMDDSAYPSDLEQQLEQQKLSSSLSRQRLYDVIQEALTTHVNGLRFRERNAGHQIDEVTSIFLILKMF